MRLLFGALLAGHGLIHLTGAVKAFGIAEVPQLSQPVSRPLGALWLVAAMLQLATAVGLFAWPRWWWGVGAFAAVVSQAVIMTSWNDAKYGTLANALLVIGIVYGYLSRGPISFQAQYEQAVNQRTKEFSTLPVLTDADLSHLPAVVQKYLRVAGAVGQPRAANVRAIYRGEIRGGPAEPWMKFTAEQFNTFGVQPSRYFLMKASRAGVPFESLHIFAGGAATMRVKLASLLTVANAAGPEMNRAETVTLFNDMFLLAPSTLVAADIRWEQVDALSVRAMFSNAGQTISAKVTFRESGELANFDSADRLRSSQDGKTFEQTRWTTPVGRYQAFGPLKLWSKGEARWHPAEGEFAYGRFELQSIEYNVGAVTELGEIKPALTAPGLDARSSR